MSARHRVALDARGPLQNREDHPEWRQLFILAALHRAEAVSKLRDLPSAPTKLPEIVVPVPAAPPITITAAVTPAPSTQSVAALAPAADAAPVSKSLAATAENTPAQAVEEKPAEFPSLPVPDIEAPPITITPAAELPVASKHSAELGSPADVGPPEASSGNARIAVPLPKAAPAELRKVAGIRVERSVTDPAPEEATGSIDTHPGATIPVEIGETSSTELPIVLPPERPPVLRKPKRTPTRAKRPAKPQPAKRMGLLDVWLLKRNQASASSAASPAAQSQTQAQTQTANSPTAVTGN